jgi:hypothetical protein
MGLLSITRKKIAVVSTVAVMGLGGGIAYAFFTSTGSSTGNASVGSATTWTVAVANDTTHSLYPGSGSESLAYTITNAGTGNQQLSTITASVADSGSCLGSWFTAVPTTSGLPVTLAHNGTYTGTVAVALTESGTNQNACQGISPVVTVNAG